jgi:DNA-binding SARP family transcriptional activator
MLYSQGIYGALISGNIEASAEYLKKMTLTTDLAKPWLSGHHNYHRAWDAFSRGELAVSLACSRTAHAAQADTGWYFSRGLTAALLAQVLFETGDHAGAARYLAEEKEIGASMKSLFLEFNSLMLEAYFSFASKTTEAKAIGLTVLKRAMELGGKANLMNLQGLKRSTSAFLCVKAMEAGIEMEYVRRLISAHRLMPEEPPLHIENWPWPLKVYAFGRFEIFKDGSRLLFSGKIQRKPLDMLKLLIAHGGKDLRDELITEALWPEADGDAAYQSYETTLYRLRRMIGVDNAILRQEGCLTLDPRYWWTDAWAFEWMLETNHCEKALALYRGRFLDGDGEKQWLVPMRERLRSKFLRATTGMGETYEQSEQWDKALECYRKALEADSLAEEFYQRLMTCYQRLGRRAEALAVYNRCRDVLSKVLGIGPSHKTEELYLAIRNK